MSFRPPVLYCCAQRKGPMKLSLIGPNSGNPEIIRTAILDPALALLGEFVPLGDRRGQRRGWLADDLVVGWPMQRLEGQATVPDLAVAGVVIADQRPRRGLRRADDDEGGHCDAGGSAQSGNAAHEGILPKKAWTPPQGPKRHGGGVRTGRKLSMAKIVSVQA